MYMRGKWIDEFLRLNCAGDILSLNSRIFPNVKEISEAQSGYHAITDVLNISPTDKSVVLVCPGDGKYSRLSTLAAFRTKWRCINIDPIADTSFMDSVHRLEVIPKRVEDFPMHFHEDTKLVIGAVHSHAPMLSVIEKLTCDGLRCMMAIPCCVSYNIHPYTPQFSYIDPYLLSPKNQVNLWREL